mmetsp:Transcript_79137/g.156742  ORF Transcript_79137/g.156742 Transcript_79137/m.156742 type:complete len:88 (+) Transcript_79137:89-352(+)
MHNVEEFQEELARSQKIQSTVVESEGAFQGLLVHQLVHEQWLRRVQESQQSWAEWKPALRDCYTGSRIPVIGQEVGEETVAPDMLAF